MKEVDTHVDPELIREVFGAIEQSITENEYNDLSEIFSDQDNVIALNSMHPEKPMNILHYLALNDAGSVALPYLTKYIDPSLYKQRDCEGDTPINNAISSGRLYNAKVLVDAQRIALKEKGLTKSQVDKEIADTVNINDNKGQTPLHRAAYAHRKEFIDFLIPLGAKTNIKDNDGNIPLLYAVSGLSSDERKCKSIIALVKNSQELNIHGSGGQTALEILRETQKSTWGLNQERELIRACDRNKGICCAIS